MKKIFILLIIIFVMYTTAGCNHTNKIYYQGSNSLEIPMQALADAYTHENPQIQVKLMGNGSDSFHISNEVIFGQSRQTTPEEESWIKKYGPVQKYIFCYGALAIIVNCENPIRVLNMEQLRKIYSGQINNWKDVGGYNNNIMVVSRGGRSGSEQYFEEKVLKGDKYTKYGYSICSNEDVVQIVSKDKFAIGFVEIGFVSDRVKLLALADNPGSPGILPEREHLQNKTYPLTRPLYLLIKSNAQPKVKDFLNYILSSEGQSVLENIQYAPIKQRNQD